MVIYSSTIQSRAQRAWRCSPFCPPMLEAMAHRGIPLAEIAGPQGHSQAYTHHPLSLIQAEQELMWLIQVGILRREVDGQGITDSYRLAPLGRILLPHLQQSTPPSLRPIWPSVLDHCMNQLTRWRLYR